MENLWQNRKTFGIFSAGKSGWIGLENGRSRGEGEQLKKWGIRSSSKYVHATREDAY